MRARSLSFLLSTLLFVFPNLAMARVGEDPPRDPESEDDLHEPVAIVIPEPVPKPKPKPISYEDDALNDKRERRHLLHNTMAGAVGGIHVVDAGSGAHRAVRTSLAFGGFGVHGWLDRNERHLHFNGTLALSWTPAKFLEIYGAVRTWRDSNSSPDRDYFQSLGDWSLGAKAFHSVLPWLTLGADASLRVPFNTLLRPRRVAEAISSNLRANITFDLRELPGREAEIPLILRVNAGYQFNRSSRLVSILERDRYDALETDGLAPRPLDEEHRHLISSVERFGLQIDRTDQVPLAVGLEAPIPVRNGRVILSPIAEWLLEVPIDRGRYACRPSSAEVDPCLSRVGFAAYRQSVVLGLRVMPPVRGLNLFVAGQIGVTGVNTRAQELAPQAPYGLLLGISYAWDPKWEALNLRSKQH
jgi:OmpA-OmpF porin, OOP family